MSDAGFAAEDEIDPSADDADLSVEAAPASGAGSRSRSTTATRSGGARPRTSCASAMATTASCARRTSVLPAACIAWSRRCRRRRPNRWPRSPNSERWRVALTSRAISAPATNCWKSAASPSRAATPGPSIRSSSASAHWTRSGARRLRRPRPRARARASGQRPRYHRLPAAEPQLVCAGHRPSPRHVRALRDRREPEPGVADGAEARDRQTADDQGFSSEVSQRDARSRAGRRRRI